MAFITEGIIQSIPKGKYQNWGEDFEQFKQEPAVQERIGAPPPGVDVALWYNNAAQPLYGEYLQGRVGGSLYPASKAIEYQVPQEQVKRTGTQVVKEMEGSPQNRIERWYYYDYDKGLKYHIPADLSRAEAAAYIKGDYPVHRMIYNPEWVTIPQQQKQTTPFSGAVQRAVMQGAEEDITIQHGKVLRNPIGSRSNILREQMFEQRARTLSWESDPVTMAHFSVFYDPFGFKQLSAGAYSGITGGTTWDNIKAAQNVKIQYFRDAVYEPVKFKGESMFTGLMYGLGGAGAYIPKTGQLLRDFQVLSTVGQAGDWVREPTIEKGFGIVLSGGSLLAFEAGQGLIRRATTRKVDIKKDIKVTYEKTEAFVGEELLKVKQRPYSSEIRRAIYGVEGVDDLANALLLQDEFLSFDTEIAKVTRRIIPLTDDIKIKNVDIPESGLITKGYYGEMQQVSLGTTGKVGSYKFTGKLPIEKITLDMKIDKNLLPGSHKRTLVGIKVDVEEPYLVLEPSGKKSGLALDFGMEGIDEPLFVKKITKQKPTMYEIDRLGLIDRRGFEYKQWIKTEITAGIKTLDVLVKPKVKVKIAPIKLIKTPKVETITLLDTKIVKAPFSRIYLGSKSIFKQRKAEKPIIDMKNKFKPIQIEKTKMAQKRIVINKQNFKSILKMESISIQKQIQVQKQKRDQRQKSIIKQTYTYKSLKIPKGTPDKYPTKIPVPPIVLPSFSVSPRKKTSGKILPKNLFKRSKPSLGGIVFQKVGKLKQSYKGFEKFRPIPRARKKRQGVLL